MFGMLFFVGCFMMWKWWCVGLKFMFRVVCRKFGNCGLGVIVGVGIEGCGEV